MFAHTKSHLSLTTVRALLVAGIGAACSDAVAPLPTSRIVTIAIVASPDRDTLGLADSLVFTVDSDTARPERIVWVVEPRGDSLVADTLVYRPRTPGSEFIRAWAEFPADRAGAAVRRVVARPNAAPVATIGPATFDDFARIPVGDTIELVAGVTDPDGDSVSVAQRRWFRQNDDGSWPTVPLTVGDTVRIPAIAPASIRLRFTATDPVGGYGIASFTSVVYDPVIPATWRRRIGAGSVSITSHHPAGWIIARTGSSVVALAAAGEIAWTYATAAVQPPISVGDDGAVYLGAGDLVRLNPDGTESWRVAVASASGPALMLDGSVAILGAAASAAPAVRVFRPDGVEQWYATPDSIWTWKALAVGADSTLYSLGSYEVMRATVGAYTPAGTPRWSRVRGVRYGVVRSIVPADDSTILVVGDSLHAIRRDGSARWSLGSTLTRYFHHPAIGYGRGFFADGDQAFAIDLTDGAEAWRVTFEYPVLAAPVLTADGDLLVGTDMQVVALDAATGQERWRRPLTAPPTAALLLMDSGDLVVGDARGYVEVIPLGTGPLASPWPQAWADPRRTGREHRP